MSTPPPYNPYAPPTAQPEAAPPAIDFQDRFAAPAPRGARIVAHLLDWMVVLGGATVIAFAYFAITGDVPEREAERDNTILLALIPGCLAQLGAQIIMGQSFGKRLLKLRVVADDGRPASAARVLFGRNVFPLVIQMFCGLFSLVDAVSILRPDGRTYHDRLARTRVVRAR